MEGLNGRAIPGRGILRIFDGPPEIAAAAADLLVTASATADAIQTTSATADAAQTTSATADAAQTTSATADAFQKMSATADAFQTMSATAAAAPRPFTLALAGGSTPRSLYLLLADAAAPYRTRLPWERIHFFWGDERHVPPDHPDSNYRMAREAMLDRVPVEPANVHRIAGEISDARQAAAAYEQELCRFFALPPDGGWPHFDHVLLGLGEEGHTASLFPGSPALDERERLVAAPWVAAQQTYRITLTPPVLNHAARVVFLVSGAQKAAALHEVLEGGHRPHLFPAQVVQPAGGELLWFVDRAAASRLTR